MSNAFETLAQCLAEVRKRTDFVPEIAIALGSGLGSFAGRMKAVSSVSYKELDGFPVSTVQGHEGRFVFAWISGVPAVLMQGRVHYYEGYSMEQTVMPIRLMGLLGARTLLLTNAAGGIGPDLSPGDLMMITGHIASFMPSPLRGENIGEHGPRFPDMSAVYDIGLQKAIKRTADKLDIPLKKGVYLQVPGPQYETPEEIRMYRLFGADAVGMSTAAEAMAARHMGMRVCGISCVTNMAAGISGSPLSHEEVQETANKVSARFSRLITGLAPVLTEGAGV